MAEHTRPRAHAAPFALGPLQASDRAFKAELSKLEDLDVWAAAKNASKAELSSR